MVISITPVSEKDCWSGSTWTIDNEDALADRIVRVAIGQAKVVEGILHATDALLSGYDKSGFKGARNLLSVGESLYHRDGWIFQVIAWIAAHLQDDKAMIRAPQMIKADKGLDGLIIEFDENKIAWVVICEEKATEKPRQQVQSAVWPEFKDFETGARDNELIASVAALLAKSVDPDPDTTVASILWREKRAYRVAVTVGELHSTIAGRKRLFKDYETTVRGDTMRRRAETLFLEDVRDWLDTVATKAIAIIDAEEAKTYV